MFLDEVHIYVLTLQNSKKRQEYIKRLFNKVKINNYEFFYQKKISLKNYQEIIKNNDLIAKNSIPSGHRNFFTAGEIGNYFGVFSILENAIKNKYEKIIIFEDDLLINSNFINKLNLLLLYFPDDWEIISLSWTKDSKINYGFKYNKKMLIPYDINYYNSKNINIGTESLIINSTGYKKLYSKMFPMFLQTDKFIDMLKNLGYIKLYVPLIPITKQNQKFKSDIQIKKISKNR
jgi:GR25 family glycosyltransferase involved in LPS biosynthesis